MEYALEYFDTTLYIDGDIILLNKVCDFVKYKKIRSY